MMHLYLAVMDFNLSNGQSVKCPILNHNVFWISVCKVCSKTGLSALKFHDLCKSFASILAQNGVSTAVTQRLLEHLSPILTNMIYTNVDPVLWKSIDQIPIENWLER